MTPAQRYRAILANHLPPDRTAAGPAGEPVTLSAVDWVYRYLDLHRVHFHITLERRSKLGDYRWPQPRHEYHEISINGDLNPYLFLWVFLHEAAHLETHLRHTAAQPHGHEWQEEYRRLIVACAPLFPPDVQPLLARLARRIPLNRSLLRQVEASLHRHDPGYGSAEHLTLDQLAPGSRFRLKSRPDILFESIARRRTRWLCRDVATGRQYTVAANAEVTAGSPSPSQSQTPITQQ